MNKFGIFNLLNSFSELFNKSTSSPSSSSSEENSDKNPLSQLFSSLNNASPDKETSSPSSPKLSEKNRPLISPLLNTINSHEQFVKRVKQNQPKK